MKKLIYRIHLYLGLASGLVMFVVSLTGCLYVFEEEIRAMMYRDFYFVAPQQQPEKSIDQIVKIAQKYAGNQPVAQVWRKEYKPGGTFLVYLKNREVLAFDPYDGKLIGHKNMEREWLAVVEHIHTSLLLGDLGNRIIAWATVIYAILLISGIVLWWPKNRKQANRSFKIKWTASPKRLNYDLHNVLGFYAAWILIVIVLTGLWWSFDIVKEGVYALIGRPSFEKRPKIELATPASDTKPNGLLEKVYRYSVRDRQYIKQSYLQLPSEKDSMAALRVLVRYEIPRNFLRNQNSFYFDPRTGVLLREDLYKNYNTADAIRASNYVLHTGSMFGLAGKIVAFFASLISTSLPITGFLIWWNKRNKVKRKSENSVTVSY
ncbi:MAG: PepSY-associated TM helix domain-containing protein [Runella sp.]